MPKRKWTTDRPAEPGFYYAVPVEHDSDQARTDISDMADGYEPDDRPLVLIADIGPDDLMAEQLLPYFAGIGEYAFKDLAHDFATVWWYGPIEMPPPVPGLGPVRPPGDIERLRFRIPRGWPPEE